MIPKFKFKFSFPVSKMMETLGIMMHLKDTKMLEALNEIDNIDFNGKIEVFHSYFY